MTSTRILPTRTTGRRRQAAGYAPRRSQPMMLAAEHSGGWTSDVSGDGTNREASGLTSHDDESLGDNESLRSVLEDLDSVLGRLARVDLALESRDGVADAAVWLEAAATRLAAQHHRVIADAWRRQLHVDDGAATLGGWLAGRTTLSQPAASRKVTTARRLRHLPLLTDAFTDGTVTLDAVRAITTAAVPGRADAIAACEPALVDIARHASTTQVRLALAKIRDTVDPDASNLDVEPIVGADQHDPRRDFQLIPLMDGMVRPDGLLPSLTAHKLRLLLDAFDTPDPATAADHQRRSAGQRRADALADALDAALDAGTAPIKGGVKPHVLAVLDLHKLLDHRPGQTPIDGLAGTPSDSPQRRDGSPWRIPRLGALDPHAAAILAEHASWSFVLCAGPWRPVNVSRRHRSLPGWLRPLLEAAHEHCRGPDCDRPATWCDADHASRDWAHGADTDLNDTVPLCRAHHRLKVTGKWTINLDPTTGTVTWTRPNGTNLQTRPPPRH